MAEPTVMSSLNEVSKIPKLNGPDDWAVWDRKLKVHLGMVDMYKVLTVEDPTPSSTDDINLARWTLNQDRLSSLLLITGPSALSLLDLDSTKNATQQYKVLKDAFNKATITTFSTLYRRVFECKLSDHRSVKEYGEEVATARNKLKELGRPLDELAITCVFLNGLDPSYQAWKDMYLGEYAKNPTHLANGVQTMTIPTIEEVIQLLIDRQSSNQMSSPKGDTTPAFRAMDKKGSKGPDRPKSSPSPILSQQYR
ncbi:hypothetical protein MMC07_008726 [Pseudocyphellaria aurata]|nr:hypothetical protein [Pseudocyphellaria aurata]